MPHNRITRFTACVPAIAAIIALAPHAAAEEELDLDATIESVVQAYADIQTYSGQGVRRLVVETDSALLKNMLGDQELRTTLAFQRPRMFRIEVEDAYVLSDADTMHSVIRSLGQRVMQDAPDSYDTLEQDYPDNPLMTLVRQHTVGSILLRNKMTDVLFGYPIELQTATSTVVDESPAIVLAGVAKSDGPAGDSPVSFTLDPETYTLRSVAMDVTKAMRMELEREQPFGPAQDAPKVDSAKIVFDFQNQTFNQPLPDDTFEYTPEEGIELVETFRFVTQQPAGVAVGSQAPDIQAETLQGDTFKLEQLRGKVVLLDFWATWCGPCVKAMPALQELSDKYKDKGLVVLGVNRDEGGENGVREKVKGFLEDNNLTFGHIMDPSAEIAMSYGVRGLPTTVIIDQKGVVRNIHTGYSPQLKAQLTKEIATLIDQQQSDQPGG